MRQGKSLVIAAWPQQDASPLYVDEEAVRQFGALQELVRTIRNARNEYKVEPARKIQVRARCCYQSIANCCYYSRYCLLLRLRFAATVPLMGAHHP